MSKSLLLESKLFSEKIKDAKKKFKVGEYVIVSMREYCKEIENLCGIITYKNKSFFVVSSIKCTSVRYSFCYVDAVLYPERFKIVTRREAVITGSRGHAYW